MSKQKVLILAAVPDRLRVDQEIREIEEAIRRAVELCKQYQNCEHV